MGTMYLVLFAVTIYMAIETEAVPLLGLEKSALILQKNRRISMRSYPHRTMMFTGYYRPRSKSYSDPTTNVYAQGNAISGGAYLGGLEPVILQPGPNKERPVSSAEAEAAPDFEGHRDYDSRFNDDDEEDQKSHSEEPPISFATESTEEALTTPPSKKKTNPKKKKTPIYVDREEEDELEDEYDDVPAPFVPIPGNKRSRGYLPFNTYFPMVFSFPGVSARSGTSRSAPGTITAVANSYSTSKGGVASSVATAYGGSPNG